MTINTDDFLDEYIQTLKDPPFSRDFSDFVYTDEFGDEQTVEVEQQMRDIMGAMVTEMWHHSAQELTVTATNLVLSSSQAENQVVLADPTSGSVSITLPSAALTAGKTITVKKVDASANRVRITSSAIDGLTFFDLLENYEVQSFLSDGTQYWTIGPPNISQRGSENFSASSSEAVSLPQAMPSSSYQVMVSVDANPGGGWWITSKTTAGFTINFSGSVSLNASWEAKY